METRCSAAAARRSPRARRLAVILSVVVLAVVQPAASSLAVSPAAGAGAALSGDSYEAKVELYVNQQRSAHGLRPLRFESCADLMAERWAERLATTGDFVHQSSGAVLGACHVSYAGETLGRGRFGPRTLLRQWMRSPAHRAVVLSPLARRIGVGSHLDVAGRWVTAASFTRR